MHLSACMVLLWVGAGAAPSLLGAVPVTPVFTCVCFHNILWLMDGRLFALLIAQGLWVLVWLAMPSCATSPGLSC